MTDLKAALAGVLAEALKGGEGSGNFGHAGRPGKVGGSKPLGWSRAVIKADTLEELRAKTAPNAYGFENSGMAYWITKDGVLRSTETKAQDHYEALTHSILADPAAFGFSKAEAKKLARDYFKWAKGGEMADFTEGFNLAKERGAWRVRVSMTHVSIEGATFDTPTLKKIQKWFDEGKFGDVWFGMKIAWDGRGKNGEYSWTESTYQDFMAAKTAIPAKAEGMGQAELKEALKSKLAETLKGGSGSGNFNHAGRPGKVGGSQPQGAGGDLTPHQKELMSQIDRKPWDMTWEEFDSFDYPKPTKPGYIVVYHVTKGNDRLPSIIKDGLKGDMAIGGDSPKGTIWASATPKGYTEDGTLVAYQIPEAEISNWDTGKHWRGNVNDIISNVDIPPEDILAVFPFVPYPPAKGVMPGSDGMRMDRFIGSNMKRRAWEKLREWAKEAGMLKRKKERLKGGEGSGNFGHAGRPGKVGGSGKGAGGQGARIITDPEDILKYLADSYEKRWGWDKDHTREEFIANHRKSLSKTPIPQEFIDQVRKGVDQAIKDGRAGSLPVIIIPEREGYNDRFVGGDYEEGSHIRFFYHPTDKPEPFHSIEDAPTQISATYPDYYEGVYIHEYGHHFAQTLNPKTYNRAETIDLDSKAVRNYVKKNLSYYASTNYRELAAEAYAARHHPDFNKMTPEGQRLVKFVLGEIDDPGISEKEVKFPTLKEALAAGIAESLKGGAGSGNFNHAGRPGKIGGSQPMAGHLGNFIGEPPGKPERFGPFGSNRKLFDIADADLRSGSHGFYSRLETMKKNLADWDAKTPEEQADKWTRRAYFNVHNQDGERFQLTRAQYAYMIDRFEKEAAERVKATQATLGIEGKSLKDIFGAGLEEMATHDISIARGQPGQYADDKERYAAMDRVRKEFTQPVIDRMRENMDFTKVTRSDVSRAMQGVMDQIEQTYPGPENEKIRSNLTSWLEWEYADPIEKYWEFENEHQIALGKITTEQAETLGWWNRQGKESPWQDLPKILYHVTTNSAAVKKDQLRSRRELKGRESEVGLAGGEDHTISFTGSAKTAKEIERAIQEAHLVANGKFTMKDLVQAAIKGWGGVGRPWLKELLTYGGYNKEQDFSDLPDDFDPFAPVKEGDPMSVRMAHFRIESLLQDEAEHLASGGEDRRREAVWDWWHINYVQARQRAGGFMDPLFFGTNWRALAKLNPKEIKTHRYTPKKGARGYPLGDSLGEWRTVGGDTVKLAEVMDWFSPDDLAAILGMR